MAEDGVWETAGRLSAWLDGASTRPREVKLLLQVLKITEEAGEAAEALHGMLGANPRKGHSHTEEDVARELSDVILTAMVALSTLTPDAAAVFRSHLDRVAARSLAGTSPPAGTSAPADTSAVGGYAAGEQRTEAAAPAAD